MTSANINIWVCWFLLQGGEAEFLEATAVSNKVENETAESQPSHENGNTMRPLCVNKKFTWSTALLKWLATKYSKVIFSSILHFHPYYFASLCSLPSSLLEKVRSLGGFLGFASDGILVMAAWERQNLYGNLSRQPRHMAGFYHPLHISCSFPTDHPVHANREQQFKPCPRDWLRLRALRTCH